MDSIVEQEKKWLLNEKYHGVITPEYEKECLLLENGMPVAYLIGNIEFLGCTIDLEYKPLIPRPETEYWADIFIKKNKEKSGLDVLDIFSGSGCIGIACAKHLDGHVDFGELQEQNITQINKNILINLPTCRNKQGQPSEGCPVGSVLQSDVFGGFPEIKPRREYDFILANPPYIARDKENQIQESVIDNEDDVALFADSDGLYFVYQLIDQGSDYLKSNGEIWIEFDPWQVPLINEYLKDKRDWSHSYLQDQYKKDRVLVLKNGN